MRTNVLAQSLLYSLANNNQFPGGNMKKSFYGFTLTLVMAFGIASCGKDGGGSSGGSTTSLLTSGSISQSGAQVVQSFQSWAAQSPTYNQSNGSCGTYTLTRKTNTISSNQNCSQKSFLGIKFYVCSSSSNSNGSGTQSTSSVSVACSGAVNSGYSQLSAIISSGTIIDAVSGYSPYQGGTVYNLVIQRADSSVVTYVIDTYFPAAFQPVIQIENSTGAQTTLVETQRTGN